MVFASEYHYDRFDDIVNSLPYRKNPSSFSASILNIASSDRLLNHLQHEAHVSLAQIQYKNLEFFTIFQVGFAN